MNKKLFILIVKYMPIIQMIGILLCNILSIINHNGNISRIIDFFIGNNIITIFLLYICSYLFGFCKWHRLVILANFINLMLILFDVIFKFDITNIQRILSYFTIDIIFLIIIIIIKFKCKK